MREAQGRSFYQIKPGGVVLSIQAQPGAKKSEWQGLTLDGYLKLRLNAPAQEGKANQELFNFLSENLRVRKSDLEILSGEFSRKKRVLIKTDQPDQALEKIKGKADL